MATITVTELNRNISAALRLADREDLVIERGGRPVYKVTRLPQDDPVDQAVAAGRATRVAPTPSPLVPRRVEGVSSVDTLSQARGRR
ncbi:MAG: hypothetical protein FWG16_07240 [Micrococcales bacterium]|nr:hypothetical protein [Micrococcales bacterium]